MIPTMDQRPAQQLTWEQRLLKNAGKPKSSLKPEYQELKFTLHRKLLDKINLEALATIDNQRVRGEVRQALVTLIDSEPTLLSSLEKQQICDEVLDEVFGLGPLEPLLQDPTISDILVNGCRQVYVERRGLLELTSVTFRDDSHLIRIIDKIVSQVGRRIDESTPMVDARLSDGSRVNAIIPPLALDGPLLSIRRFAVVPLTIPLLTGPATMSTVVIYADQAATFLQHAALVGYGVVIALATAVCFTLAQPISRFLGQTGINVMTRLMGLILAALAVEVMATGLVKLFPALL